MARTLLSLIALTLTVSMARTAEAASPDRGTADPETKVKTSQLSAHERELRTGHMEVPDHPYVPVPREGRETSPPGRYVRDEYVSVQANVDPFGQNIIGDAANEPSIAVNPVNPNEIAIGWRQFDDATDNFRQAGWGYTSDGGETWTFPGVIEPTVFRSDPVLGFNAQGDFFYNSLTATSDLSEFWCNVYKSTDGGASWDEGVYACGGDKQWMTIDRTGGIGHDNIYAYWTKWFTCPGCTGHFTRSYDAGASFLPTTNVPGSPQWGTLTVGPDGELYVVGDGFTVAKSTTMQDSSLPVAWDFSITVSLDGGMTSSGGPNPGGLLGQAWIATDHSSGPTRGNVYLLCSVQRWSTPDPLDVMFSRSTDGGATWSDPVRINDDPSTSNYQWFSTMSVAPNGRIDAIWNDTRSDPGGYDSELTYSYSENAGLTWSANVALSLPFDPHIGWPDQNKIGDYYDMVSDNLGADIVYSATFNGEQDVYYLRIGNRCEDAGTVALDRPKYACEGTAGIVVLDCGLNMDNETIEYVTVDVESDSETGAEEVTLTETNVGTARFEGSINLSTTDDVGILHVAEGDTITVTYIDADDGEGGVDIEVTASAPVDCTGPIVSNVQTVDIGAFDASVTFDTDEPTIGTVRYGESCGALTETAAQGGYRTDHSVKLSGLAENRTYFYAVDAEDEAGNPTSDDNGGDCYSFQTTDIPSYFTEEFTSGFDLEYTTLKFVPNGSNDYYVGCAESIDTLPTDPATGAQPSFTNEDDGYATVSLGSGHTVSLYGTSYSTFYIGSNGYITFGSGDSEWDESLGEHFSRPRISGLYDDFSPQNGGGVWWEEFDDRVAVTWLDVPEYTTTGSNTFQVEMFYNGALALSYLSCTANDGIVGLSAGDGTPQDFIEMDLSAMGDCIPDCNGNGVPDDVDLAEGTSLDCNENLIPDECDIAAGTSLDCQPNGVPDECEVTEGTSEDCNGNDIPDECDIADGNSNDYNGNGIPDECELVSPLPENSLGITCTDDAECPYEARCELGVCYTPKHRYLSIAHNPDQVPHTARRVTLAGEQIFGWVGAPYEGNGLMFAELVSEPVYADVDFTGDWPAVVHVTGCIIATGQDYDVQAIQYDEGMERPDYSEAVTLHTPSVWGDVVSTCVNYDCLPPNGDVSIDDILATIAAFQSISNTPLVWFDIAPSDGANLPNQSIDIDDILANIQGFQSRSYPGDGPFNCP